MRLSLHQIPVSADLLTTSGMPLAVSVQPLALPDPAEDPIQVVDFGEMGPVRCKKCKAYMNPFMRFIDGGKQFVCNICGCSNDTPREYFCHLGGDGRRRDWMERPELHRGTVEYVANQAYMVRPPMPPSYLFMIDVSTAACTSGAAAAACQAVKRTLGDLPGGERTMVGVATFDSSLHFYRLPRNGGQPHMLVVADVAEPYAPLPAGLVVPLAEHREALEGLLEAIPGMFTGGRPGENAAAAAVKAGVEALKATGGRVALFATGVPTVGMGALRGRDGRGEGEKEPLRSCGPSDKTYAKVALDAAEYQVAIDLFLLAAGPCDVPTLGTLCNTTGGSLYHYPAFNPTLDFAQLHNDLRWNASRPQGLEAVARLRVSQGLSVVEYAGAFCKRTPTDVDLPTIDSDKALLATLRMDDKLTDGAEVCLQFAMLYTTTAGERRIRVHTMSVGVTGTLANLFRSADLDVQLSVATHKAAARLLEGVNSLAFIKDRALVDAVSALYAYRRFCATNSSAGQLILPEALKLLPLYTLGLVKSAGLRPESSPDERAAWAFRQLAMTPGLVVPSVYPRLFRVSELPPPPADGTAPQPPCTTWLSSEKLDPDGVFFLENGLEAYIWVGKQTPREVVHALFGVDSVEALNSSAALPPPASVEGEALHALINTVRQQRSAYMRMRVLRRPDIIEGAFFSCMIEDRSTAGMSYVEFLCHVHRQIQAKFV